MKVPESNSFVGASKCSVWAYPQRLLTATWSATLLSRRKEKNGTKSKLAHK